MTDILTKPVSRLHLSYVLCHPFFQSQKKRQFSVTFHFLYNNLFLFPNEKNSNKNLYLNLIYIFL